MTEAPCGARIRAPGGSRPPVRGRLALAAGLLLAAGSFHYLVSRSLSNVREAGGLGSLLEFDPLLLVLSFALLQVHFLAAAWSWKRVASLSGSPLGFRTAYSIHFVSVMGKYLPGKVWAAVGKVGLSRRAGLSTAAAGRAIVLETLMVVTCTLLVMLPLVPRLSGSLGLDLALTFTLFAVAITALLLSAHPGAHRRIAGLAGRLVGRDLTCVDPGFGSVLRLLPVYITVLLLQGIAFHALALSFGVHLDLLTGICMFPASVGIGFLVLLAPAGIGVTEVSLVWLMALATPQGERAALPLLALASRLWVTLSEVVSFFVAVSLWGGRKALREAIESARGGSEA